MRLAIIGGTGVNSQEILHELTPIKIDTPYGSTSLLRTEENGSETYFLLRHGSGHSVPPHRINYRANIWALSKLGVEAVITTSAVGSLRRDLPPGELVLIDSFLDFTSGRDFTFFDGHDGQVIHTDMTYPYCRTLRSLLARVADDTAIPVRNGGCYVCTNGPRYETAAEIRTFALLGGDVVGMTGVPEVVLARELGMCYATIALVTNLGAGLGEGKLVHDDVVDVMHKGSASMQRLLLAAVELVPRLECTSC